MGIVDGFKGAGLFTKVSLILLIISAMFSWIAYTCTGWGYAGADSKHYGLWRSCTLTTTSTQQATAVGPPGLSCEQLDGWPLEWWRATQALVTFGFFGINIALFLTILYMFVPRFIKNGEVGMTIAIVCNATAFLYLIGVIVFGAKFTEEFINIGDSTLPCYGISMKTDYKLGYCFGLSIVALLAEIVAGMLMFLDSKKVFTSPSAI